MEERSIAIWSLLGACAPAVGGGVLSGKISSKTCRTIFQNVSQLLIQSHVNNRRSEEDEGKESSHFHPASCLTTSCTICTHSCFHVSSAPPADSISRTSYRAASTSTTLSHIALYSDGMLTEFDQLWLIEMQCVKFSTFRVQGPYVRPMKLFTMHF